MTSGRAADWRRFGAAALLGGVAAFGQAPWGLPIVMLAALVGVMFLYARCSKPRQAALLGWAFGSGYFIHCFVWITSPFMVDVARHGWMAPFALVLLSVGAGLFWAVAFGAARWLSRHAVALILLWPAVELIRAYLFTGFPWGMFSQALVGVWAGQALSTVGPYALTLWVVGAAALLALPGRQGWRVRTGQGVLALVTATLLILPPQAGPAPLTDYSVRLIQPNAAQRDKWDPEKVQLFFDRQLEFTNAPPAPGDTVPDLVVWSETAIPWPLDLAGTALAQIAQAAGGTPVMMGVQRRTETRYFNSAVVLGPDGAVQQTYDKHHLVPFGEYMPWGDMMARFGIHGLAAKDGNGFSSGPGPALFDMGPLGAALPLICYEAVFAHDVNATPARPAFLVQMTNDAWFGKGPGPMQHLAQARMRAIEQGLPLARSANTGVSAMIDPWGRITAMLPLNQAGFVDAVLPAPRAPTLYSRTGDLPFALMLLLGFVLAVFERRRRR